MAKVVGIDTGKSGALVVIENDIVTFFDKYIIKIPKKPKGFKSEYDEQAMANILRDISPDIVYLESAQAMPGQGVVSMFSTGFGYGLWKGLLTGLSIKYETVGPKIWQGEFFKGKGHTEDTKGLSYQIASSLYPLYAPQLKGPRNGLLDGRCDALLIAEYCRRKVNI